MRDFIGKCLPCPEGKFSFTENITEPQLCDTCLPNFKFNCYGGSNLTIKHDVWRSNPDSNKFLRCPKKQICLGDENKNISQGFNFSFSITRCQNGYEGPLCTDCENGFGKTSDGLCSECIGSLYYVIIKHLIEIYKIGKKNI